MVKPATKWTKVLKFLNNTLNMKNSIANWFVFRPPSHSNFNSTLKQIMIKRLFI